MLDVAGKELNARQCTDGNRDIAADRAEFDALDEELRRAGFRPAPRFGRNGDVACGVGLKIPVRDVLEGNDAGTAFLRRLCDMVEHRVPVNVSAENLCGEQPGVDLLQHFCEAIAASLSWRHLPSRDVGLCIHSHQVPLEAYRLIAGTILGDGPRYVFFDSLQMCAHGNRFAEELSSANWRFLWRQRGGRNGIVPVYGGLARSACPLLADEVATTVLPGRGLHSPVNAAWLPVTLPITNFVTGGGRIHWPKLSAALRNGLAIAEQLLARVAWHDEAQQIDARHNRRVAIEITGIGDLVAVRGEDPASLACLDRLAAMIARLREDLVGESSRMATVSGALPALEEASQVSQWRDERRRDTWRRHWDAAIQQSAMRHRNLLAISPYAVLPRHHASTPGFSDLLPLIALADAWTFAAPPDFSAWNADSYRRFHRRARAIMQGAHTASFIAAGV